MCQHNCCGQQAPALTQLKLTAPRQSERFSQVCVRCVMATSCKRMLVLKRAVRLPGVIIALVVFLLVVRPRGCCGVQEEPLFPACFVFGDSLADPGNNNFLPLTVSRANFPFNGVDFPRGEVTGRFSNGRTVVDVLTEHLGFQEFVPAYLDPATNGSKLLRGVNYASGAGGILESTGANYVQRLSMNNQIHFFQSTLASIRAQVGVEEQQSLVAKALFVVIVGSNDYINNYLLAGSVSRAEFPDPDAYSQFLVSIFQSHLRTLHSLGARKFLVTGVGPLGCIPSQLANQVLQGLDARLAGICLSTVNNMVLAYNRGLQAMLTSLTHQLAKASFLYADSYTRVLQMVQKPSSYGPFNGVLPCDQYVGATICTQRSKFLFWDPYHPSDAANVILGTGLFNGTTSQVRPINVEQLAAV